jgi:hypothetical protein
MEVHGLLDKLPLWALFPFTLGLLALGVEFGFRLVQYRQKNSKEEPAASVGPIVTPILGLLAFMLAFTFGMAGSRFETRRQVVLAEANAITTTYLRASLLPEPMRTETQSLLRQYVDARLEAAKPEKLDASIARSEELLKALWSQAVAVAEKQQTPLTSLFIQSLNQVIELHETRVMAALRSRIPSAIWLVLYLLAVISMAAVGYGTRLVSPKRSLVLLAMILAFSAVLVLIADLDRPGHGLLEVSQQSMLDLKKTISQ